MTGKTTSGSQDKIITNAENCTAIGDLIDVIQDLDERLAKAIERLKEHGIADDI
jgi:hypothetical protein